MASEPGEVVFFFTESRFAALQGGRAGTGGAGLQPPACSAARVRRGLRRGVCGGCAGGEGGRTPRFEPRREGRGAAHGALALIPTRFRDT